MKHNPDWWLQEELLPPDPWAYIVSDFQWGWEILNRIQGFSYRHKEKPLGHFTDEKGKSRKNIEFALNTIFQSQNEIKNKISEKSVDIEFLWLWGEYQKALAILEVAFPEYKRTQKANKNRSKEDAREWYTLWYEWYRAEHKIKSRAKFDKFLENILQEIRTNRRKIETEGDIDEVQDLIAKFTNEPANLEYFKMTNSFRQKDFSGEKFEETLQRAKAKEDSFPLVGEEHYPEI